MRGMEDYGAKVELGKLKEKKGKKWRVESYSRKGIITPPLTVMPLETAITDAYQAGDKVFYAMECDGTGVVLCKVDES